MRQGIHRTAAALLITAIATPVLAQTPQLLRDINDTPQSGNPGSEPADFVQLGNYTIFTARTADLGREVYASTGPGTTQLLRDIRAGAQDSDARYFTAFRGHAYFQANDGVHGPELWRTDGTPGGTELFLELEPGANGSGPRFFTERSGVLYFDANTSAFGAELWHTDGTALGTMLYADLVPGPTGCRASELIVVGTEIYFFADWTDGRRYLMWTRPAPAYAAPIVAVYNPSSLVWTGARFLFKDWDAAHGTELWQSDGTALGTGFVKDIKPGLSSSEVIFFGVVGGAMLMGADDGTSGRELWRTNGTGPGTVLVKDVYPGAGGSWPQDPATLGGQLYFSARDPAHGEELWKSDGTEAGTVLVKDVWAGTSSSGVTGTVALGSSLIFAATDPATFGELWKSDGTAAGTVLLKDINTTGGSFPSSSPSQLRLVGGHVWFRADDDVHGHEPWRTDGTTTGTVLVDDVWPPAPPTDPSNPTGLVDLYGTTWLAADDGSTGAEPWRSDGTTAGTVRIVDLRPGATGSDPREFTHAGGAVFFHANDGRYGQELWITDGTAVGTTLVKDIYPGSTGASVMYLASLGDRVVFSARDPSYGAEPWVSDGTAAGTVLLKDIRGGSVPSSPAQFTRIGDRVYFVAYNYQVWSTDGTPAGTVLVKHTPRAVNAIEGFGGALWIISDRELYRSDGTAAGTVLVQTFANTIRDMEGAGEWMFLAANDTAHGTELWRSDGTTAGTVLVKDIRPGTSSGNPQKLAALGAGIVFRANPDTSIGYEPFYSDGTEAGTVLLGDLAPGSDSSGVDLTTATGTRVAYFVANDRTHGLELWRTDGTAPGTRLVADLKTGIDSSSPSELTFSAGRLLFRADDGIKGAEPWWLFGGATSQLVGFGHGIGGIAPPTIRATDPVLGATTFVTFDDVPSGASGFFLIGIPAPPFSFGGLSELFLDPGRSVAMSTFAPNPSGPTVLPLILPNVAGLTGIRISIQAIFAPTSTPPLGLDLTEGLWLTLGY